jgi:excisionase family DNA binding protein
MTSVLERRPVMTSEADAAAIRDLDARLGEMSAALLVGPDGTELRLPEPVYTLLSQLVHDLARGNAVSVVPIRPELTPEQAADLLNVRHDYLLRMLDTNELPSHGTGFERRVRLEDLLAYRQRRRQEQDAALAEMLRDAQDMGLYDETYPIEDDESDGDDE